MAVQKKKYVVYAREVSYYKRIAEGTSEEDVKKKMDRLLTKDTFDFVQQEFYITDILEEGDKNGNLLTHSVYYRGGADDQPGQKSPMSGRKTPDLKLAQGLL